MIECIGLKASDIEVCLGQMFCIRCEVSLVAGTGSNRVRDGGDIRVVGAAVGITACTLVGQARRCGGLANIGRICHVTSDTLSDSVSSPLPHQRESELGEQYLEGSNNWKKGRREIMKRWATLF